MRKTVLLLCALPAASPGWGRPAAPAGQMVVPAAQPFVSLRVNGQPLRLKVDLGAHGSIILNPDAAARAGLVQEKSVKMNIGPVKLRGSQASPGFELGDSRWKSRVMWFDRSYVDDADGAMGPHHLPFADVVFEGPGRASGAPFALEARYTDDRGVFAPVKIAGKKVAVRFSLLRPRSFATGAAGALLAKQHNGSLELHASRQAMGWGISRPVRQLNLSQPWAVGSFRIPSLLVRLRDFRGKSALPLAVAEVVSTDILVTGRVSARQSAEHFLTLGLEQLQSCRSITYSREAERLSFSC